MKWIDLSQNRDRCRGLLNAVRKIRFNKMREFFTSCGTVAFQEGFCSME
jgi:hypothetical protein